MFEKEAKERAKDFTDNKAKQVAYECGFLDGADRATEELKEKLAGAERTRDNLRQIGFPTFQSCKEYAERIAELEKENVVLKTLIENMQRDVLSLVKDRMNDDVDQNIIERLADKWGVKRK